VVKFRSSSQRNGDEQDETVTRTLKTQRTWELSAGCRRSATAIGLSQLRHELDCG
jgi:hypothetical protein